MEPTLSHKKHIREQKGLCNKDTHPHEQGVVLSALDKPAAFSCARTLASTATMGANSEVAPTQRSDLSTWDPWTHLMAKMAKLSAQLPAFQHLGRVHPGCKPNIRGVGLADFPGWTSLLTPSLIRLLIGCGLPLDWHSFPDTEPFRAPIRNLRNTRLALIEAPLQGDSSESSTFSSGSVICPCS